MGIDLDKLTRFTAWVFGDDIIAACSFSPDILTVYEPSDGSIVWQLEHTDLQSVAIGDGVVAVSGKVNPESLPTQHFVRCYSSEDGELLWSKIVAVTNISIFGTELAKLAFDSNSDVIFAFNRSNEIVSEPDSTEIGKLSVDDGLALWNVSAVDLSTAMACDPDGGSVVAVNGVDGRNSWLRKYSIAGSVQWAISFPGEIEINSVACDADGNTYATIGTTSLNKYSPTGALLTSRAGSHGNIAIDEDGVWFSSGGNLQRWNFDLNQQQVLISGPSGPLTTSGGGIVTAFGGLLRMYDRDDDEYVEQWTVDLDNLRALASRWIGQ